MAKKEETQNAVALARQTGLASLPDAPDFMKADEGKGLKQIAQKVRPPILKIVQKQSSDELISLFGVGTMITVPDRMAVTDQQNPVRVVPVYMFIEYQKLSAMALKGIEPMVVERSTDPKSDLARRCADRKLWEEEHPKHPGDADYNYRNCEALIFLLMFQEEHLQLGMPVALPFSRGSYGKGQSFCNLVQMRKNKPPYGCVFSMSVDPFVAANQKGEWRRPLLENPPERPWVDNPEEYKLYKQLHEQFEDLYQSNAIEIDLDDEDLDGAGVAQTTAGGDTGSY